MGNSKPKYTRKEFIQEIKDDASESCGIPVTVNAKRMDRLITKAQRYFYQLYDGAYQDAYVAVARSAFSTELFRKRRMVRLPDCVKNVFMVKELRNGARHGGNPDPDYDSVTNLGRSLFHNTKDIVITLAMDSYSEFIDQFDLTTISYDYNENTNNLTIIGRDPKTDLILSIAEYVELEALFSDTYFYDYVLGMALKSISKPLSVFNFTLIGGTTVDFGSIADEGQSLIDEVKQVIDDQTNTADFFIIGDQMI